MNTLFFEGPLLSWLVTYAVHSTLILGAVWLLFARTSIGSLRLREAVWKTALVGGLVTASLQSAMVVDSLGGRWLLPSGSSSLEAPAEVALVSDREVPFGSLAPLSFEEFTTFTEVDAPVPETTSVNNATSGTNGAGATLSLTADLEQGGDARIAGVAPVRSGPIAWGRWTLIVWSVVGGACLLAMAAAWRRLGRYLSGRRRVREGSLPGLLAMLRRQGGVRRHVRLYTCPSLSSPLAIGSLFPQICLPERIHELRPDMQESILAHELAHIARFDPLWLIGARALEVVFFFQPLNRVARRHMQQSAELLCDDWAVDRTQRPIVLARSLAEVAGWLVGEPTQLACGMVAHDSALRTRVTRLVNRRRPEPRSPWILPAGATLLSATALLAPGFADQVRSRTIEADVPADAVFSDAPFEELDWSPIDPSPLDWSPIGGPMAQLDRTEDSIEATLEVLAVELAVEFAGIAHSLSALRASAESKEITDSLAERIDALDRRAQELLIRKERMEELVDLWGSARSIRVRALPENPEVSR